MSCPHSNTIDTGHMKDIRCTKCKKEFRHVSRNIYAERVRKTDSWKPAKQA